VIESTGAVFRIEMREQVRHAGEDREALAPAVPTATGAELESHAKRTGRVLTPVEQQDDGLCKNEREVLFQSFTHAHALVRLEVIPTGHVHPDLVASNLDREDADIVGPWVEGSATGQVEAGVVPVAGQDAVLDAASIERKAHVRAAVVHSVDALAVAEEDDRMTSDGGHFASRQPNVGEIRCANELRPWCPRFRSRACSGALGLDLLPKVLEIVAQVLGDLIAPVRILLQAAPDDPGKVTRQIRPQLGDWMRGVPENRGENLRRGRSLKGSPAGGQFVEDDTKREDVRAVVDTSALRLLGRHVRHGAQ
jgi:hypothetical protein